MDRTDPTFQAHPGRHVLIALGLGLVAVVVLTLTAPHIGLTWDEPAYIAASESYMGWFNILKASPQLAMQPPVIEGYWRANNEHPPLDKIWSGWVWNVARNYLDDLSAHRLGNMLLAGGLVSMLYLLITRHYGPFAGLMAVLLLMTMPRFFFHAHLAALDVPAAAAVLATVFAFWLLKDRHGIGWDVLLGLIWGLALATKVNALFVPPTLFVWLLFFQRRGYLVRRLVVMGLLALPVFLAVWPWLYDKAQFGPRLNWYIRFVTVDHWKIGQYYLGQFWMPPPWHFPLVITLAVTPLTTALLGLAGAVRVCREPSQRALGGLLLINVAAPLAIPVLGNSLLYDNDRLFMPAFPFLAALGGIGAGWIMQWLESRVDRWLGDWIARHKFATRMILATVIAGLMVAPQLIAASGLYPHLLSYYSETVGGLRGATRLRLETTYWCETYASALPYLNAHAKPGDVIWVDLWSHDVLFYFQRQGQLRPDVRVAWPEDGSSVFVGREGVPIAREAADWVLVHYRQTGFDEALWRWLKGQEPVLRLGYRDIPLMELYASR